MNKPELISRDTQFRILEENLSDMVWIIDAHSLKPVYLSPSIERITGYSMEEIMNMPIEHTHTPESLEMLRRSFAKIRVSRQSSGKKEQERIDAVLIRKDGSLFHGEHILTGLYDAGGEIAGIFAITRDITERKQKEERLSKSEQMYRAVFENVILGLFWVDHEGRFLEVNPAFSRILGYASPEEFLKSGTIGRDLMVDDESARAYFDLINKYGYVMNFEARSYTKDRGKIWVSLSTNTVNDMDDNKIVRYGIVEDITARKITEKELKDKTRELVRSNAELEQFAYIASHDLQEPLRMISGFMELLSRRYKGRLDNDADEFISFSVEGARRMQQLINDLLAYSRVGTGTRPFEAVDCREALDRALENLSATVKEHRATIEIGPLPVLTAERVMMTQLFQNLIANAVKFHGPEPPRITVSAERGERGWIFSVGDNGIGLESQYFERIFEVFQRIHRSDVYPGTGIGLAICKKIVERHGGRIWVESQLGRGTTFFFTLADKLGDEHVSSMPG